jgi:pimeloyl-ACP methyl ester carboxylesterase/SH3-like domain-containing protein
VELENLGSREQPDAPVTLPISASGVNLRTGPSTDHSVYTNFTGPATVNGRNEAGDWLRLLAPGGSEFVWVYASVVTVDGDVMTLPVVAVDESPVILQVATNGEVNWYDNPVMTDRARGTMDGTFPVNGRDDTGDWLQVVFGDGTGWVQASDVTPEGDIDTLAVVEAGGLGDYGPMQAFYFRTGVGDTACEEAPNSGILVQTPRGAGEVTINVNGLEVALASTAVIQTGAEIPEVGPGAPVMNFSLLDGKGHFPDGSAIFPGQTWTFVWQDGQYQPYGHPQNFDPADFAYMPVNLLPDRVDVPQRGVLETGAGDVVYNYFMPGMDTAPSGCVGVFLHNARADMTSWYPWLTGPLLDDGWGVWAPDMPGHGQSPGADSWDSWGPVVNDAVPFLQDTYGYDCGVFFGSSIGANTSLWACGEWPGWCRGVVAYSPGLDFGGYNASNALGRLGDTPVYIATGQHDTAGASGDIAEHLGTVGDNVTVQIYDTDVHGSFMSDYFPLWNDMSGWWSSVSPDGGPPPSTTGSTPTLCPPGDSLTSVIEQLSQNPDLEAMTLGDVLLTYLNGADPKDVSVADFLRALVKASGVEPCN